MIRSMTAFTRKECKEVWGVLVWEIRTLNHRYLEITARLPDSMRVLEPMVRERVDKYLSRGKVECNLRFQPVPGVVNQLNLNNAFVERLAELAAQANQLLGQDNPLSAKDVLRWPGVIEETETDLTTVNAAALSLFDEALADLLATREREGERLCELVNKRSQGIAVIVSQVRARLPLIRSQLKERIQKKIADLNVGLDAARLEQEIVFYMQRMDVDEELDRMDAHVCEINEVLQRGEPVGRRLDFLMQELNREANTLGSKSSTVDTTNASVDLKVFIEQMREQIQNIE